MSEPLGGAGERERPLALNAEALATARELGMAGLAAKAEAFTARG